MTSTRPYLIRAFYEWIVDNGCTPHIVVNAEAPAVDVPTEYVEGGQIVLNIAMAAVQSLQLDNDAISFQARFGGVARYVFVPVRAVMAIYAKENGRGMVFAEEDETPPPDEVETSETSGKEGEGEKGGSKKKTGGRPHLTVVK